MQTAWLLTWSAVALVLAGAVTLAVGERAMLRHFAVDRRPLEVQRRSRRSALWLLAAAHTGLAYAGVVALDVTGAVAGTVATGPAWLLATVLVLALVLAGVAAREYASARRGGPGPVRRADVVLPGLVMAVGQELVHRGALLWLLVAAGLAPVVAAAVTAVGFAAVRLPRGRAAAGLGLALGLGLGLLVAFTGMVLLAAAVHVVLHLAVAFVDRRGWHRAAAAVGAAGTGCGSHDPDSSSCQACPLAPAAQQARRGRAVNAT